MNEAELLFTELMGCTRGDLCRQKKDRVGFVASKSAAAVLRQRMRGVPLQYILGKADFLDFELAVDPRVLVPRPETELLVEAAAKLLRGRGGTGASILDIGTGSGCIAIALAKYFPAAAVSAVDISADALAVARANAERHNVFINFFCRDTFLTGLEPSPYDLIVSNPPYIPSAEIDRLQPEVRREPRIALDGGPQGLDFYHRIAAGLSTYLKRGGHLAMEIGCGQRRAIENIFQTAGKFEILDVIKDYNQIERVMIIKWIN